MSNRAKLILTFLIGVAGHGLMVFAQKIIPIGTIGISQIAQPALALVWSFLLLGERLNEHQTIDQLAEAAGTIGYEILTSLGDRYERVYKGGAQAPGAA